MTTEFWKIYPDGYKVPEGYEIVGFRIAEPGEWFLSTSMIPCLAEKRHINYRIILKKKTSKITVRDVYGSSVTIPEGYEFVDFRPLVKGDLYITIFHSRGVLEHQYTDSTDPRIVIRRILPEIVLADHYYEKP